KIPSSLSWLPDKWKICIYLKAGDITWPGRRRKVPNSGAGTRDRRQEPGPWGQGPERRKLDCTIVSRCLVGRSQMHLRSVYKDLQPGWRCMAFDSDDLLDFLLLFYKDETAGVGRKFDGEAGNIGIKGDASDHTPGACAASLYSASAQAGLCGSTNRVEECMGWYPEILRGRILARLRIRRTKRLNKTRRPKLRILMLDSTGLACASRACKDCNGLSGGSPYRSPSSLRRAYCNLPPEVSHNQCWDNLVLCSHGIRRILGMLSKNMKVERYILLKPIGSETFSSKNPEAGWTVVKESVGCVDLQVSSFALSNYPLGRLKDGTICVRLVNP
ncbi:LOW QUALITY PROTEIN: hypothetical protein HID58_087878, partial [Brassica napus]